MNFEILDKELNNLASFLSEYDKGQLNAGSELFKKDFFTENMPKRHQKDTMSFIKDNKGQTFIKSNPVKDFNKIPNTNNANRTETSHQNRRETILNIIREKGIVSVKDISDRIKEYSEKTIQRELLSMVEEGVLNKEGERRWSKYSLRKIL
jgi:hypothetical protein